MACKMESEILLQILLKRIKGMKNLKLVDASFLWTEPHSKKINVKLVVMKEVLNGTLVKQ